MKKKSAHGSLPFKIRAVQLDLARHMETVDFIRRYADMAAGFGFNMLFLYLEGRVKTKTFPYPLDDKSYSLDEMQKIVDHAGQLGMDVVPVIPMLGHCEQFLAFKQLEQCAEERDGRARFGGTGRYSTFCPSLDATYCFFEKYLTELAEVFKGRNLHVGLDEAWNLGFCDACRERMAREGLAAIFSTHVARIEKIVSGLGKRMWMWDDMFELFPGEVAKTPKNIVMTHWQYDNRIEPEGIQAHFVNRWRQNWLAEYERLGIDAVICPWSIYPRNIETFTDYGRRHNILGGLLTQWEGSQRFHPENRPILAFTGNLWSRKDFDPGKAWSDAMETVVPGATTALKSGLLALSKILRQYPHSNLQDYLRGPLTDAEILQQSLINTALALVDSARLKGAPADQTADFIDMMEWSAKMKRIHLELRDLLPRMQSPRRLKTDEPALMKRAEAVRSELASLLKFLSAWQGRHKEEAHADDSNFIKHFATLLNKMETTFRVFGKKASEKDWWIVLRLFLRDYHGAPRLKVSIVTGDEVRNIGEGCFKAVNLEVGNSTGGHYTLQIPFESNRAPEAIRLEVWGYGGQGVAFVEIQSPDRILKPCCVRRVEGPVSHPEAVLRDDSSYAFLGSPDILSQMHHPALAEQRGIMEIGIQ